MVATLLRIRFRILGNTLAGNPWQLVGFILGGLWALGLLALVAVGLFLLPLAGLDATHYAILAGGAALTLGWVIGPVFAATIDTTLDPAKLAIFPITTTRMMVALTAAGATGIPGIATMLGGLATFAAWWRWPDAALAAVVCVPFGVAICVVASRAVTSFAAGLGGRRRVREILALVAFALILFASPILVGALDLIRSAERPGEQISSLLDAVSWTPIAAAWSVPGDVAAGSLMAAALKTLISAVTLGVLWVLWYRSLAAALVSPPARSVSRPVRAGALSWFGRMPATPVGASWARSLTYRLRDGRYLQQFLLVPFVPVLALLYTSGDLTGPVFAGSALGVAYFVGVIPYADISYDGTAFASVLSTGIRGRDERLGRMLGAATVSIPLVVLAAVVTVALSGRWEVLLPVLGASFGLLLTGLGLSAISSAMLVIPVPAPGDNPFKRVPGSTFSMLLSFAALWLATAVLAAPETIFAVLALTTGDPLWGWLAFGSGIVLGLLVFIVGVVVGGRVYDRSAPALLLRLRALKGA